ncbi:MAG: hypothetical protein JWO91_1085 [Acidobacteriaceae bacterium]|nr:hypothetical protein [Acidobacteriaceae bacterium]
MYTRQDIADYALALLVGLVDESKQGNMGREPARGDSRPSSTSGSRSRFKMKITRPSANCWYPFPHLWALGQLPCLCPEGRQVAGRAK